MIRFLIILLLIGLSLNARNVFSEEVFLSKKEFLKIAFSDETPKRKGLRFKGEVKEIAQKIMGSNYKKIRMKYWRQDQKTAWMYDADAKTWNKLEDSYLRDITKGIRIARKQGALDLFGLPIPAAETAQ